MLLSWGCQDIHFNIEEGGKSNLVRVDADPRGFKVGHRWQAQAGTTYTFRVQTANTGGVSRFSAPVTVRTPSEALASTPTVLNPVTAQVLNFLLLHIQASWLVLKNSILLYGIRPVLAGRTGHFGSWS